MNRVQLGNVDWVQLGNLAEWLAVLAAVGIAIWSRRRARQAAESADEARDRSARALEAAAAAQSRLAELAEADAARYRPPWTVVPLDGSSYHLRNDGNEAAYDVSVEDPLIFDSPVTQAQLRPGEAMRFAVKRIDQSRAAVTVHWYRESGQGGERHEWRHPLP